MFIEPTGTYGYIVGYPGYPNISYNGLDIGMCYRANWDILGYPGSISYDRLDIGMCVYGTYGDMIAYPRI